MSQIEHNISFPNDGLGDALRTAFDHQNSMNSELYENKVDKIDGQGLSENNFTDELKSKLENLDENAEENVQTDWNQTDNEADDFIKNKPDFTQFASVVGFFNYGDTSTFTTPIAITSGISTPLVNDGEAEWSDYQHKPYGVNNIWNIATNKLNFNDVEVGDIIKIRVNGLLANGGTANLFTILNEGGDSERRLPFTGDLHISVDDEKYSWYLSMYIANDAQRLTAANIYILTDADTSFVVQDFFIEVVRRNVNITNVVADLSQSGNILLQVGAINADDDGIEIFLGTQARISGNIINAIADYEFLIDLASTGKIRTDIVFITALGWLVYRQGDETASGSFALKPATPLDCVMVTQINVTDGGFTVVPGIIDLQAVLIAGNIAQGGIILWESGNPIDGFDGNRVTVFPDIVSISSDSVTDTAGITTNALFVRSSKDGNPYIFQISDSATDTYYVNWPAKTGVQVPAMLSDLAALGGEFEGLGLYAHDGIIENTGSFTPSGIISQGAIICDNGTTKSKLQNLTDTECGLYENSSDLKMASYDSSTEVFYYANGFLTYSNVADIIGINSVNVEFLSSLIKVYNGGYGAGFYEEGGGVISAYDVSTNSYWYSGGVIEVDANVNKIKLHGSIVTNDQLIESDNRKSFIAVSDVNTGIFYGTVDAPENFIQFNDAGFYIQSPNIIEITAPSMKLNGVDVLTTGDGAFDLKVDKGVNNLTTTVLTSATLNSTYPTAEVGFKVYCTNIIAGKMVYEKHSAGWIGYACIIP